MTDAETAIMTATKTLSVAIFTAAVAVLRILLAIFLFWRGRRSKKVDDIIQLVSEYRHGTDAGWSGVLALTRTSILRFRSDRQIHVAISQLEEFTGSSPLSDLDQHFDGVDLRAFFSKGFSEKLDVSTTPAIVKVIESVKSAKRRRLGAH